MFRQIAKTLFEEERLFLIWKIAKILEASEIQNLNQKS